MKEQARYSVTVCMFSKHCLLMAR